MPNPIQQLTIRDAEIFGDAPLTEKRVAREQYVDAQYTGLNSLIKNKKGDSYLDRESDGTRWMFRPYGSEEWYRVNFDSLRFVKKRTRKKNN
jgi:hypothetical protein